MYKYLLVEYVKVVNKNKYYTILGAIKCFPYRVYNIRYIHFCKIKIQSLLNYVPHVLSCTTCSRYTCSHPSSALCLTSSRALHFSCRTCSRASRALYRKCTRASRILHTLVRHVSCTLRFLLVHVLRAFCSSYFKFFKPDILLSISYLVFFMSCGSCDFGA